MTKPIIHQGDVLDWAAAYQGEPYHAMLCDPPYHLTEVSPTTINVGQSKNTQARDEAERRARKGFMGKTWDGGDLAFRPETWRAFWPLLHPGAFCMAFASSRGWHRMACAIEDAGYILHPTMWLYFAYGSGFPKATRIDTQIDRANGREFEDRYALGRYIKEQREALGISRASVNAWFGYVDGCEHWERQDPHGARVPTPEDYAILKERLRLDDRFDELIDRIGAEREIIGERTTGIGTGNGSVRVMGDGTRDVTAPATDLARAWAGHRYGLQAIKPAVEPIIVFQKPYAGRPVDSITRTGAGALNIDLARIQTGDDLSGGTYGGVFGNGKPAIGSGDKGRWPANLILSHLPSCEPRGTRRVRGSHDTTGIWSANAERDGKQVSHGIYGKYRRSAERQKGYTDADGYETITDYACAPGCAVAALGAQSGEIKATPNAGTYGGIFGNGKPASDSVYDDTGTAARFFFQADYAAERLEAADAVCYVPKASTAEREAGLSGRQKAAVGVGDHRISGDFNERLHGKDARDEVQRANGHPTIKPIALARHLAALLLPPSLYAPRRLFVPFAGVASECIGAMQAGWEHVEGVELEAEHVDIARARIEYWAARGWQRGLFDED